MDWKGVAEVVGKAAPMVGTLLGGSMGGTIGSMVASLLGVEQTPDSIAQALKDNPDALLKIKQFELDNEKDLRAHVFKMSELDLKEKELYINDRMNARAREVQMAQTGKKDYTQPILAYIGVMAFFAIVGYVVAIGLADMSKEASFIIGNLTGIAAAIAKDVYGYYFGSSEGSKTKTDIMTKASSGTSN